MKTKLILACLAIVMLAICIVVDAATPVNRTEALTKEASIGKTLNEVSIIGLDPTAFPKISANVFANKSCASSGGLQKNDVSLTENGSRVALDSFIFNGRAGGKSLDLAVVFDDTSSMIPQIEAMKSKVQGLIDQIAGSGMDARYALVSFKDNESLRSSWTTDTTTFKDTVNSLKAEAGGDTPEDSLDAIEAVLSMSFRPEAQKMILVITDAPAHQKGDNTTTTFTDRTGDEVKADILRSGAIFIVVSPVLSSDVAPYLDLKNLTDEVKGTWIDMASADFSHILDHITNMITGMYVLEYTSPDLSRNTIRNVQVSVSNTSCASGQATSTYTSPGKPSPQPILTGTPNFSYSGDGKGGQVIDPFASDGPNVYKVTLDKQLEKPTDGGCQDIVIRVTPDKIPTKDYVVFAIDHSGSTYQGGYSQDIVNGIGQVLGSISGVKYERIDWNDQNKPVYASSQFHDPSYWVNENQWPEGPDPTRPNEEQSTIYSKGLTEAVNRIVQQKDSASTTPLARKTTGWKVIFITGKSEFYRGESAEYHGIIDKAKNAGIDIYTIGIQIASTDPTTSDERNALQNEIPVNSGFGLLQGTNPSVGNFVTKSITDILSGSGGYYSGPVAKNLTITESIYSYLSPVGSSMRPISQKINPDRSTTMKFDLGNLNGGETKTIRIYTALDLSKLPIDINKSKTRVDFSPDTTTPPSIMTYTSLIDTPRSLDLPEGQLSIFCGEPCPEVQPTMQSPSVIANETKLKETSGPTNKSNTKSPGFDIAFAAVGIVAAAYLIRRR